MGSSRTHCLLKGSEEIITRHFQQDWEHPCTVMIPKNIHNTCGYQDGSPHFETVNCCWFPVASIFSARFPFIEIPALEVVLSLIKHDQNVCRFGHKRCWMQLTEWHGKKPSRSLVRWKTVMENGSLLSQIPSCFGAKLFKLSESFIKTGSLRWRTVVSPHMKNNWFLKVWIAVWGMSRCICLILATRKKTIPMTLCNSKKHALCAGML